MATLRPKSLATFSSAPRVRLAAFSDVLPGSTESETTGAISAKAEANSENRDGQASWLGSAHSTGPYALRR